MTRKRDPVWRSTARPPITPAMVDLFRRIEEILDAGEENGSRGEEYQDARLELHLALKLYPWETLPCDVQEDDERPDWAKGDDWHKDDWTKAIALRKAFLAALKNDLAQ